MIMSNNVTMPMDQVLKLLFLNQKTGCVDLGFLGEKQCMRVDQFCMLTLNEPITYSDKSDEQIAKKVCDKFSKVNNSMQVLRYHPLPLLGTADFIQVLVLLGEQIYDSEYDRGANYLIIVTAKVVYAKS